VSLAVSGQSTRQPKLEIYFWLILADIQCIYHPRVLTETTKNGNLCRQDSRRAKPNYNFTNSLGREWRPARLLADLKQGGLPVMFQKPIVVRISL
jgi:hypothetical protein